MAGIRGDDLHSEFSSLSVNQVGYCAFLLPSLGDLMPLYKAGEMVVVPASATRYRDRSHFDGQTMLENGSGKPYGAPDGWLNRALLGLNGGDRRLGLLLGPALPLNHQGQASVSS